MWLLSLAKGIIIITGFTKNIKILMILAKLAEVKIK